MTWDPDAYPVTIRNEIADYDELQDQVAQATAGVLARLILDLGIGTGETAARVLSIHPNARLIGIDSSLEMLDGAARRLPRERVSFLQQDLAAPLPNEHFDLVYSALAIHHLEGERKRALFEDVAARLTREGLFVLGDVIVPEDPADAVIELEPNYDFPSSIDDQLTWMREAGLEPQIGWVRRDLAVIVAAYGS